MSTGTAFSGQGSRSARSAVTVLAACLLGIAPAWARDFDGGATPGVPARLQLADTAHSPAADTPVDFPALSTSPESIPVQRLPADWKLELVAAFEVANAGAQPSSAASNRNPAAPCLFCRDYWSLLKGDVTHVFTSPAHWDGQTWRSVGWKALIVVGMIALLDENASDYIDDRKSSTTDRIADAFEPFGREYAAGIVGGYLLAGSVAHKPKAKQIAVDAFTSTLIAAGLITPALEKITGRSRPNAGLGAHDFHPFTGGPSFPSDHVTAAFSVAASIAQHYDALWIKGLSYGLATMVGYARMEKDAHWLSDVTAGAMIGIGVARSVHDHNESNNWGGNITLRPMSDPRTPGTSGIELSVEFALR